MVDTLSTSVLSLLRRPPSFTGSLEIEWRLLMIRWLGILVVAPSLWFLRLSTPQLVAAYAILVLAAIYNGFVQLHLQRHREWFRNGYLTTLGDGLLTVGMITLAGGFGTPLYALLYTVTIAAAMRFGYGPSSVVTISFVVFDFVLGRIASPGQGLAPDGAFLIRSGFLLLAGVLASYLRRLAERAEALLQVDRKEFERLAAIVTSSDDAIFARTLDGKVTTWNRGAEDLYGYRADEIIGQSASHLSPPDSADEQSMLLERVAHGERIEHLETVRVRKDGSQIDVSVSISPIRDATGRITGAATIQQDITQQRRSQAALRESEERLRLAVEIAELGLWEWDIVAQRMTWSPMMAGMMGSPPEAFGGTLTELRASIHPEDADDVMRQFDRAIECGAPYRSEYRVKTVDGGGVRWLSISGEVYCDGKGNPLRLLGVCRNISTRKRAEQEREVFQRSERLRALGQMASGTAHDLNQSLMLIASYSDMARVALDREPVDREELREMFTIASQAALDGGETVKRLLQFTGAPLTEQQQSVDLNQVVKAAVSLSAPRWRDSAQSEGRPISLHVEESATVTVLGSPSRLREAMTNLLFNGVDALPQGGTIRVRLSTTGDHAVVEVIDSGVGMSAEVRERIFEPFFTTKGPQGTGLGLAQVFGIVEQHGGQVDVQSAPGAGTTVRLTFPLAPVGTPAAVPQTVVMEGPQQAFRILIVDDEPAMLKAVVRMLRPEGHSLRTAGSGEEALEYLMAGSFDVVVSDLGMGAGMSGWDLASAVRERWPHVRFVLATGWGAAITQADATSKGVESVLAKPYRLADLQHALACSAPAVLS